MTQQTIRAYQLNEHIGKGGFGAVYRAYQPTVGREVAIKVIIPCYANQPEFIRRFEVEASLSLAWSIPTSSPSSITGGIPTVLN